MTVKMAVRVSGMPAHRENRTIVFPGGMRVEGCSHDGAWCRLSCHVSFAGFPAAALQTPHPEPGWFGAAALVGIFRNRPLRSDFRQ